MPCSSRRYSGCAVQPFAGFYLINKTVKKIPDIRAFSFSGNTSLFRFFPLLLFLTFPCNGFGLLLAAYNLGFLRVGKGKVA